MLIIASSPANTRQIFYPLATPLANTEIAHLLYLWRIEHHRHFYESINGGEPTCIDDDIPFEIPDSWEWSRIGELFFLQAGKNISSSKIQNDKTEESYPCYGGNGIRGYVSIFNRNGIHPIIGRQGALCGNVNLASGKFYATEHAVCVETYGETNTKWSYYTLKALNLNQYATATAQPGLAVGVINDVLIPVPPIHEQHRIVTAFESEKEKLNILLQSRKRYKRILSETPTSLRQQLIQAAIQGQLVPQNPNDEPASILLERIAQERTAKLGKKAAKSMSRIVRRGSKTYELFPDGSEKDISDEIPFDIPETWEWSTLGIVSINRDSERIPLSKAQRQGHSKIYDYYGASGVIDKVERYLYDSRLLLIGEDGANLLSRSTDIAFIAEGKYWVNNHAHVLDSHKGISLDYIKHYVNGISLVKYVTGSAQPKLTQDNLNAIIIPVPPADEQMRIVEKIESILSTLAL